MNGVVIGDAKADLQMLAAPERGSVADGPLRFVVARCRCSGVEYWSNRSRTQAVNREFRFHSSTATVHA